MQMILIAAEQRGPRSVLVDKILTFAFKTQITIMITLHT
jgi:hypothetical protein